MSARKPRPRYGVNSMRCPTCGSLGVDPAIGICNTCIEIYDSGEDDLRMLDAHLLPEEVIERLDRRVCS